MANQFLLKQVWITEKSTRLQPDGKYVFLVMPSATKNEIGKAVAERYKVHVTKVNVVNRPAKKRGSQRFKGKISGHRKAYVTLKPGEKIDLE